ncbi:MAG: hypothetical protein ABIH77_00155 [Pseudomonadota bacterium]
MNTLKRLDQNPILIPNEHNSWEALAAFNPSVVRDQKGFHMLYRAESTPQQIAGVERSVSSIGYAHSKDGIHFTDRQLLVRPRYAWEGFGCEDPRATKIGDKYYIFYTALSTYPFSAEGIKVGIAITRDFLDVKKHQVTPFNAKAMALFPEKIDGKFVAVLTAHTDLPPAKITVAFFEKEEDMWSPHYWRNWQADLNSHVLPLLRSPNDHLEVGAVPVKTKQGWILIYSYIKNYFSSDRSFNVEAVLLDLNNPLKVLGRTGSLLIAEQEYELKGNVPQITFPTGALIQGDELWVYYGAADTVGCVATMKLKDLLADLTKQEPISFVKSETIEKGFERYKQNPIIEPRPEFAWELKGTLNPTAFYENGVHILYRAFSQDETSTLGYAFSKDGCHITERFSNPVYIPREDFEKTKKPGFSGCEDARITRMGDHLYMVYTAYNGVIPRVAMTSIPVKDFVAHRWNWETPRIISAPGVKDKNSCIFPRKIEDEYIILHRTNRSIYIDFVDKEQFLHGKEFLTTDYLLMRPRTEYWDNIKIGSAAAPIETKDGWLLFYHGYSDPGAIYKVGAVLLDLKDPREVLARTDVPLLQPEMEYEKFGFIHNVVFPCGVVVINGKIYMYYGAADFVIGVATMDLKQVLQVLKSS